jgi:hypothetical protein
MINESAFEDSAKRICCEIATIKAVAEVESSNGGFLPSGEVKILFEPHIFWKELKKIGIKPIISDICYPEWGTKHYGKKSEQHSRLQKAVSINREAALKSASWGAFQIMGNNYQNCGCSSIQDFVNKMMESEDCQLGLFTEFIINSNLDDELVHRLWAQFALQYNGKGYKKNNYDKKMEQAYLKYKK